MGLSGTGLLAGLASAIPGAYKGYQDATAQDLKKKEIESKMAAQAEDKKWKEVQNKMGAERLGYDITEDSLGQLGMQKKEGLLSMVDEQQAGLLSKGIEKDPETGEMRIADWKKSASQDPYKGLLSELRYKKLDSDMKNQAENQTIIPGYERDPSVYLDKADIKNIRNVYSDSKKLSSTLQLLKAEVGKASPQDLANPLSATNAKVQNLLKDAQLTYKGEAFAKLGVLTGPDMDILDQVLEDPTTFKNLGRIISSPEGKANLLSRYDDVANRITKNVDNKLQTRGFSPQAKPQGMVEQQVAPQVDANEVSQAEQWAAANPQDPRAMEIMKRLGK